jgi:hypothetical protein
VALLSQALRIKCLICVTGGSQYARLPFFLPFAAGKRNASMISIGRILPGRKRKKIKKE